MTLNHTALRDGRLSDILKNEMRVSTGLMNRLKTTDRILVNGTPQRTNFAVRGTTERFQNKHRIIKDYHILQDFELLLLCFLYIS